MSRIPKKAMNITKGVSPGFTLIELMVVIVLIVIVLAITAPALHKSMRQRGVNDAASQLAMDLQKAKLLAIERNANCSITINAPGANQYTISITNEVVDLSEYHGGVAFSALDPSAPSITFTPQGLCQNSGAIFLTGDIIRRFRVRATVAGGISVHEFSGGQWK